jgi:hypothetical protein
LVSSSAWSLQSAPTTMTTTNQTLETLSVDQLAPVTGGGIGSMIGGLFGAKGQQWGAVADNILGMFGGLGGLAGGGGGGGGAAGGLGGILKMFGGLGGGAKSSSSGTTPPTGGGTPAPADASAGGAE